MNLGELHALVRETIKRGTAYDSFIPTYVKMAVLFLERNYNFLYMQQLVNIQMTAGDRIVEIPRYIKGVEFVRFTSGADYSYIGITEARSQIRPAEGTPVEFWKLGHNKLVFNPIPQEGYLGEALLTAYSDWPTADTSRHFLLDMATDVLLGQTMLQMAATVMRDSRMVEGFKLMRDEGLNTLLRAEDELRYSGVDLSLGYTPFVPHQ